MFLRSAALILFMAAVVPSSVQAAFPLQDHSADRLARLSAPPVPYLVADNLEASRPDPTGRFTSATWKKKNSFGLFYSLFGGWLLEARHETKLRETEKSTRSASFGIGIYEAVNSRVTIRGEYDSRGNLDAWALPISAAIYSQRRAGFFRGKWGIGISVFPYSGELFTESLGEMRNSGWDANIFVPFEGILQSKREKWFIRLDAQLHLPVMRGTFDNEGSSVSGVPIIYGPLVGVTVGKLFR